MVAPRPPAMAVRLLERRLNEPTRSYLLGDLEERFHALARTSRLRASIWYWRQTVSALVRPVPGTAGVSAARRASLLATELVHAARALRRRPWVTLAAVGTLALGIGVVATAFSIAWGTLLQGLPFEDADALVHFERARPAEGMNSLAVTPHDYLEWSARQTSFEDLGAYVERAVVAHDPGGLPERWIGVAISAGSFDLLRARPTLGRAFSPDDEAPGSAPVVLLSHDLWTSRFGSDPAVVGQDVTLDGRPTTVVGVMPEGFGFPIAEEFWVPLRIDLSTLERGSGRLDVFGRLRSGRTLASARAEFDGITAALAAAYPDSNAGIRASLRTFEEEYVGDDFARTVRGLFLGAVLVLLVCCANVANLLLVQGLRRRQALALRRALGATRGAIVRQLVAEAALLAASGAAVGIALAFYGVSWFNRVGTGAGVFDLPHGSDSLFWWTVEVDAATVSVVVAAASAAVLVAGLAPALTAVRASDFRQRSGTDTIRGGRLQNAVVVAQLGLTSGLLVAAGFLLQSVRNVDRVQERFDGGGVMVMRLVLSSERVDGPAYGDHEARLRFVSGLVDALASDPAVEAAAFTTDVPLDPPRTASVALGGADPSAEPPEAGILTVTTDYFELFGVGALEGRLLDRSDREGSAPVALVNERFADRYLDGAATAVGRRIRPGPSDPGAPWLEVVGVVPTLWDRPGQPEREAGVYVPLAQSAAGDPRTRLGPWGLGYPTLVARARPGADLDGAALRRLVHAADPGLPVADLRSMDDVTAQRTARYRVWGRFYTTFAVAALLLAALGTYGVLAFGVARRTAEIGVRRALGASARSVQTDVLKGAAARLVPGVVGGLWLGAVLAGGLRQILYGVEPDDPAVFAAVAFLMIAVGTLASIVPARRAARTDPGRAIRGE